MTQLDPGRCFPEINEAPIRSPPYLIERRHHVAQGLARGKMDFLSHPATYLMHELTQFPGFKTGLEFGTEGRKERCPLGGFLLLFQVLA
jgi:hypothetical protein